MGQQKRRVLFIDPKVQGAILLRTMCYWLFCLLAVTLFVVCWSIVTSPVQPFYGHLTRMWLQYGPAAVVSLMMLPLVAIDSMKLSNRFAGPMVRLRRAMRDAANGQPVSPVIFRDNDFWRDFADDFNRLADRLENDRRQGAATGESASAIVGDQAGEALESQLHGLVQSTLPELVECNRGHDDRADDHFLRGVGQPQGSTAAR